MLPNFKYNCFGNTHRSIHETRFLGSPKQACFSGISPLKISSSILENKKHIHFIGIGGSGMYPLAQILHAKGYHLSGSDNNQTDTVDAIRALGIPVVLEQTATSIAGADLIVYTAAILPDNEALLAAREAEIPMINRASLLGLLSAEYDHAICVSGTHGKTTVSSMITQIMMEAYDPTVVIGGKLDAIHGSGRVGSDQHFICEACEYQDSFLTLAPDMAVILNIDEDHMEYFKTLERLISSFATFASRATQQVLYYGDDPNCVQAVRSAKASHIRFGMTDENDYFPQNIRCLQGSAPEGVFTTFDLMFGGELLTPISLSVPGTHNILNAVAAAATAHQAGVSPLQIATGLLAFHGAKRRFEVLGRIADITIADDYAHHPAEITVTLQAAKSMGFSRIIAVHQPFTFSRTARLLEEFAVALGEADIVILSDIMGGREVNDIGIDAEDLAKKIPGCRHFHSFQEIATYLGGFAQPGDLIITMGCGDVNKCAHLIAEKLLKLHG